MNAALLDTDTVSEILKQRSATVTANAAVYLQQHGQFAFSVFTRFEIARGYKEKAASRLLTRFATFCQHSLVLPLTGDVFTQAENLWVLARRGGHPHGDADLLIAATAMVHDSVLITGNTNHFQWVKGLRLGNWRTE